VRNRHRSAHSSGFSPAASDITGLASELICLAMCFDTAMTVSVEQALGNWRDWSDGKVKWRDHLDLYFIDGKAPRLRVSKKGRARALRVVVDQITAVALIPRPTHGRAAIVVTRDGSSRPVSWDFV
jgi:hypothetical protein